MDQAKVDQYEAAMKETMADLHRFAAATGQGGDLVTGSGTLFRELLERLLADPAGACEHIIRSPAQPAVVMVFERVFRCRDCSAVAFTRMVTAKLAGWSLGEVEEYTCDVCRGYFPGVDFRSGIVAIGNISMFLAACDGCYDRSVEEG